LNTFIFGGIKELINPTVKRQIFQLNLLTRFMILLCSPFAKRTGTVSGLAIPTHIARAEGDFGVLIGEEGFNDMATLYAVERFDVKALNESRARPDTFRGSHRHSNPRRRRRGCQSFPRALASPIKN
jgi:hypothetical protein